jgi:hypothetical protein
MMKKIGESHTQVIFSLYTQRINFDSPQLKCKMHEKQKHTNYCRNLENYLEMTCVLIVVHKVLDSSSSLLQTEIL